MMEIRHETKGKKGMFYVEENGERLAELDYLANAPGEITIYHTEVDEKLRGEGIGQDLVAAAVKHARDNKLKIEPKCPYAKKVIDRTPEMQDVLQ
ncbi:MAG: GNAT family N-acetyltransferase [Pyrinomonadaceae bacterium]